MLKPEIRKLKKFFGNGLEIKAEKGEILYSPNTSLEEMIFVEKGKIKQYVVSLNGDEVLIHIHGKEAVIPLMLYLSGEENRFYFEAIEPVVGYRLKSKAVVEFVKNEPDLAMEFTKRFAGAVNGLSKRIEQLAGSQQENQLMAMLKYLASKYGVEKEEGVLIDLKLTHSDLATWIGAARETVSRQMKKFENDNKIVYLKRKIVLLDRFGV